MKSCCGTPSSAEVLVYSWGSMRKVFDVHELFKGNTFFKKNNSLLWEILPSTTPPSLHHRGVQRNDNTWIDWEIRRKKGISDWHGLRLCYHSFFQPVCTFHPVIKVFYKLLFCPLRVGVSFYFQMVGTVSWNTTLFTQLVGAAIQVPKVSCFQTQVILW